MGDDCSHGLEPQEINRARPERRAASRQPIGRSLLFQIESKVVVNLKGKLSIDEHIVAQARETRALACPADRADAVGERLGALKDQALGVLVINFLQHRLR